MNLLSYYSFDVMFLRQLYIHQRPRCLTGGIPGTPGRISLAQESLVSFVLSFSSLAENHLNYIGESGVQHGVQPQPNHHLWQQVLCRQQTVKLVHTKFKIID